MSAFVFRNVSLQLYTFFLQAVRTIDSAMAAILVLTFLVFMAVVALNLFIALLSNTFQRVYDNAQSIAVLEQVYLTSKGGWPSAC
jgi:hypothetical protein